MARHRWVQVRGLKENNKRPQVCMRCPLKRVWVRDGLKANGHTPRYAWGYNTERGFVVPEKMPPCKLEEESDE
jgi:hypothetical protein